MTDLIRILIVDDHFVVRQGLAALLIPRNGMQVVGEAASGREAIELARTLQPDVILMDMIMPEMDGPEATACIKEDNPDSRILVLTSFGEGNQIAAAIQAGALGYLSAARGDHDEALRHYRDAVALRPDCLDMLTALAATQDAAGRPAEAAATRARIERITDA